MACCQESSPLSGRPLDADDLLPGVLPEPLGPRHTCMHPVYHKAMHRLSPDYSFQLRSTTVHCADGSLGLCDQVEFLYGAYCLLLFASQ